MNVASEEIDIEALFDSMNRLYHTIRRRYLFTIQMVPSISWHVSHPNHVLQYETILNAVDNSAFIPAWQDQLENMREVEIIDDIDSLDYEQLLHKTLVIIQGVHSYQRRIVELRSELDRKREEDFKWAFRLGLTESNEAEKTIITTDSWRRILLDLGKPYFRDMKPNGKHTITEYVEYVNSRSHTFQNHDGNNIIANFDATNTPLSDVICFGKLKRSRDFVVQEVESQIVANIWGLPRGWHMSNFVEVAFPFADTTRTLTHVLDDSDVLQLEFRLLLNTTDIIPETVWKSSVDSLWVPLPTQRTITGNGKGKILVCLKTRTKALSGFGFGAGGNSGGAFGDPYINPVWGRVYKLPVDDQCYRFLDVGTGPERLVVNIKCWVVPAEVQRQTTAWGYWSLGGNKSREFFKNNPDKVASFAESVGLQSFIREVAVFLGGKVCLVYNLEDRVPHVSNIDMSRSFLFYGTGTSGALPVYQRDPAECVVASLSTRFLGQVRILLNRFYNPQLRTGLTIMMDKTIPRDACGLMCRHYVPDTVRTRDLLDQDFIRATPNDSDDSMTEIFIENGAIFNVNLRV